MSEPTPRLIPHGNAALDASMRRWKRGRCDGDPRLGDGSVPLGLPSGGKLADFRTEKRDEPLLEQAMLARLVEADRLTSEGADGPQGGIGVTPARRRPLDPLVVRGSDPGVASRWLALHWG